MRYLILSVALAAIWTPRDGFAQDPVSDAEPAFEYRSGIHFDSDNPDALLIREIAPGSPAARARILPGDTIVSIDDEPFASAEEVERRLTTLDGEAATIIVLRDGRERAVIYASDAADVNTFQVPVPKYGQPEGIGIRIHGASDVLVTAVWEGSPADRAGILPGDRLVAVNDVELRGADAFVAAIASHAFDEAVEISLRRGDVEQEVVVEPERWTLAFDEEPTYLEGWRERAGGRLGCYAWNSGGDYVLLEREYGRERDRFESELAALRTELERMRAELAETNSRLAELHDLTANRTASPSESAQHQD